MSENEATKERVGSVYHAGDKPPVNDAYSVLGISDGYLTTEVGYYNGVDENGKGVWEFMNKSAKDNFEIIAWTTIKGFDYLRTWYDEIRYRTQLKKRRQTRNSSAYVIIDGVSHNPMFVDNFYIYAENDNGYAPEVELFFKESRSGEKYSIEIGRDAINWLVRYLKENQDNLKSEDLYWKEHEPMTRDDCERSIVARYDKEGTIKIRVAGDGLCIEAKDNYRNEISLNLGCRDVSYMYREFKREHFLDDNQDD